MKTLTVATPREHVVVVTLNRPEVANAMNTQMGLDLLDVFDGFCAAPNRQRCVVVTGAGAKAFCAGGDLKQRNGMTDEQWQDQHRIFERMIRAIIGCPVPVIAAVNGAAYAGGLEIALCADFIYAAEHARFALTEVTLGIMPGRGRNAEPATGRRRTAGKGNPADRAAVFGAAGAMTGAWSTGSASRKLCWRRRWRPRRRSPGTHRFRPGRSSSR